MNTKKISVYIISKNYGKYLTRSIKSVLNQTFTNWELFLVDDGSSDNTSKICRKFLKKKKVFFIKNSKSIGLQKISNLILNKSRGDYIIRLDADDWFHENALELMYRKILATKNCGMVYPGYYYVDSKGQILGVETNFDPIELNHVAPHGACCLISVKILKLLGGYNSKFKAQDGWDIWLKLKNKYSIKTINLPLFYYRKHEKSLSNNYKKILKERSKIISNYKKLNTKKNNFKILSIIPVKTNYKDRKNIPFIKYKSKNLITHAIYAASAIKNNFYTIVTSSDLKLLNYSKKNFNKKINLLCHKRSKKLDISFSKIEDILLDAAKAFVKKSKTIPDIIVFINIHTISKNKSYINSLIDNLIVGKKDSVFSVLKQSDPLFTFKNKNIICLNKGKFNDLDYNTELVYNFDNTAFACWYESLIDNKIFSNNIGFHENQKENIHQIF